MICRVVESGCSFGSVGALGCKVKQRVHIAIRLLDIEQFTQSSAIPVDCNEKSIRACSSDELKFEQKLFLEAGAKASQLLIEMQDKLRECYAKGFEDIKFPCEIFIYIKDSGIDSYKEFVEK